MKKSENIQFFQLLNKTMFNATLKTRFSIDISWRCLKTLIGLNKSDLVIIKFPNFKFDLKEIIKQ